MTKRIFDIVFSSIGLIIAAPIILLAIAGIRMASPGPGIYWAARAGRGGRPYLMAKLRTMHLQEHRGSEITAPGDARIFAFGRFLRLTKLDEIPQLFNVLKGDMSLVGPRPESFAIVESSYEDWMLETLKVRPGITSPGAIFGYTHGDGLLDPEDPEGSYISEQLPAKLAIERAYIERETLLRDISVIFRTFLTILQIASGRRQFPLPREATEGSQWHDFSALRQPT